MDAGHSASTRKRRSRRASLHRQRNAQKFSDQQSKSVSPARAAGLSKLCSNPALPGSERCRLRTPRLLTWQQQCDQQHRVGQYNGLQLNITTRNLHGLTGTFAYTYSKAMDNATDAFRSTGSGGSSIAFPQNPLNPDAPERGVSGNDFTNVFGLGFIYDFPRTQRKGGLLSRLINGYALDSIYRYNSGQPYTFYQPIGLDAITPDISYGDAGFNGDFNVGVGVDTSRLVLSNKKAPLNAVAYYNPYTGPIVNGNPTLGPPQFVIYQSDFIDSNGNYNPGTPMDPATAHWIINNQAYAQLVGNPYPGSGRGLNRGVPFSELDATIIKNTPVTERISVELSMAAYNALNQAYRGTPGAFVGNPVNLGILD